MARNLNLFCQLTGGNELTDGIVFFSFFVIKKKEFTKGMARLPYGEGVGEIVNGDGQKPLLFAMLTDLNVRNR